MPAISRKRELKNAGSQPTWTSTPLSSLNDHTSTQGSVFENTRTSPIEGRAVSNIRNVNPKMNALDKKPTFLAMICEAIKETGDQRKGASVQAIRKWLIARYELIDDKRLSGNIRKGLLTGTEKGVLDRPKSSKTTGARGFFVVKEIKKTKDKPEQKPKIKRATDDVKKRKPAVPKPLHPRRLSTVASDSEVTLIKPDPQKLRRLTNMNYSDSELPVNPKEKMSAPKQKQSNKKPARNRRLSVKTSKIRRTRQSPAVKSKAKKTVGEKTEENETKPKPLSKVPKKAAPKISEDKPKKQRKPAKS